MRNPAPCDLLVQFDTALTYLLNKVTRLIIGLVVVLVEKRRRQTYESTFWSASVQIKSTLSPKKKKERGGEGRRQAGIKGPNKISRGTDQAEQKGWCQVHVAAAYSPCSRLFSPALAAFFWLHKSAGG